MKNYAEKIINFFETEGYIYRNPISLISTSADLLFTNSTTRVFMNELLNASFLESRYFTVQPCLTNHNLKKYDTFYSENKRLSQLSHFTGVGVFQSGKIDLNLVTMVRRLLISEYRMNLSDVCIVIPENLMYCSEYIKECFSSSKIYKSNNKQLTEWSYGNDSLTGNGIGFYTKLSDGDEFIQFCDLIEIENSRCRKFYTEFCFSLEYFIAIREGHQNVLEHTRSQFYELTLDDLSVDDEIYLDSIRSIYALAYDLDKNHGKEFNWQQKQKIRKYLKYSIVHGGDFHSGRYSIEKLFEQKLRECEQTCVVKVMIEEHLVRINRNLEKLDRSIQNNSKTDETRIDDSMRIGFTNKQVDNMLSYYADLS